MRDLREQLTDAEAAEIPPNLCGAHPDRADARCRDCIALFTMRGLLAMRATWEQACREYLRETRPRLIRRKSSRRPNELSR